MVGFIFDRCWIVSGSRAGSESLSQNLSGQTLLRSVPRVSLRSNHHQLRQMEQTQTPLLSLISEDFYPEDDSNLVRQAIYTDSGRRLIVSQESGNIQIYNGQTCAKEYSVKESGPIYQMDTKSIQSDSDQPYEYLFSTSKDQPVHMWDLQKGSIVTQFVCRNQILLNCLEEVISPLAIKCTPTKLLTGHNKGLIKLFDIRRPDEPPLTIELKQNKSRIHSPISSLDMDQSLLAIGTFDRKVYLIDENQPKKVLHYLKQPSSTGVSQVKFMSQRMLIVAGRRDNQIAIWDIRKMKECVMKFQLVRNVEDTNQRMHFNCIEHQGRQILAAGNTDGSVIVYDVSSGMCLGVVPAMFDSVGAIAMSSQGGKLLMASGSGQRVFHEDTDSIDSDDSEEIEKPKEKVLTGYEKFRNALRVWEVNLGQQQQEVAESIA